MFDGIVKESTKPGSHGTAFSNPYFELWICLHYQQTSRYLSKDECQELTKKLFKKHENRKYKKNDEEIFNTLKGRMKTASINAGKLHSRFKDTLPSEANPCTTVHLLIKSLEKKVRIS